MLFIAYKYRNILLAILLCILTSIFFPTYSQFNTSAPAQSKTTKQGEIKKNEKPKHENVVYKKGFDKQKIFVGGGLGLQFGTITAINVDPIIGYTLHRMVRLGLSFNFSYYRNGLYSPVIEHFYGGLGAFVRFYPIKYLFLHAEFEGLNHPYYNDNGDLKRKWFGYPIVGVGYNQPLMGNRAGLTLAIMWNFNDSDYSIYNNPIISIGFDIGL